MHIGIDARLPAYRQGGISQYVLALLPALAALDGANRYTVFHSRKDGRSHLPPGAPNFRRATLWTPPHHRLERWMLGAELRPCHLDIIHSPDFIPPAWGARRRVITVHDLNFLHFPDFLTAESRRYYRDQIAWATRVADHIVADSEHTRQDLLTLLNVAPEKVTTVHLAANPLFTQTPAPHDIRTTLTRYGLPTTYILFVGTLEPRKNLPTLFAAYDALRREEKVDIPLVLAGAAGWLVDEIFDAIATRGLRNSVHHLPGLSDHEIAHLYHAAALFVLPSHYEGFGLPVLEAMHSGCPVICSDRGSLPEIAGDAALILPADDAHAWADAMRRLLDDSALQGGLIARGREQARRFTWTATARKTIAIYAAVL